MHIFLLFFFFFFFYDHDVLTDRNKIETGRNFYGHDLISYLLIQVGVRWHEVEGSKLIQTKFDVIKTSLTMARDMFFVRLAYTVGFWKIKK
jgi:hypothetical protein